MPSAKKKKAPGKKSSRPALLISFLALLVGLTLGSAFVFIFFGPPSSHQKEDRSHLTYEQSPAISQFSQPPVKKRTEPSAAPVTAPAGQETNKHAIAIVIDDMGYQKKLGRQFLNLDLPLSFSFLPHGPFTGLLEAEARQKKKDILLHIPLEPHDSSWDLGPGALMTSMGNAAISRVFAADLAKVPMAIGVNNHMGSKFSEDRRAMTALLLELKKRRLFFLDSLTSPRSVGFELAEELSVDAARRNVFLDNVEQPDAILAQLQSLVRIARRHGNAIGIAHPKATTLEALRKFSKKIPADVGMVEIHQLVL